jgi:hypothetical protein
MIKTILLLSIPWGLASAAATGYAVSCPPTAGLNQAFLIGVDLTPKPSYSTGSGEVITITPGKNVKTSISGAVQQSIGSFGFGFTGAGSAPGNVSVTFTNSQGWTNPPPCTVKIVAGRPAAPLGRSRSQLIQGAAAATSGECCQTLSVPITPKSTANTLIMGVWLFANPAAPYAGALVKDNLNNDLTLDCAINYSYNGTHAWEGIFREKAVDGITSLVINNNYGNQLINAVVGEFTNIAAETPVDVCDRYGADSHAIPGWVTGPMATTNANDLIIGWAATADGCSNPPVAGIAPYLLVATSTDCAPSPTNSSGSMVWSTVNSAGAYTPSGTQRVAMALGVAYKTTADLTMQSGGARHPR